LCDGCADHLLGLAAGMIKAGPSASMPEQVESAMSTSGWFARLRKRRRAEKS
jgi:hypothetical protein